MLKQNESNSPCAFSYALSFEPQTICQSCNPSGQGPLDSLRILSAKCAGLTDTMFIRVHFLYPESGSWKMGTDQLTVAGTRQSPIEFPERKDAILANRPLGSKEGIMRLKIEVQLNGSRYRDSKAIYSFLLPVSCQLPRIPFR